MTHREGVRIVIRHHGRVVAERSGGFPARRGDGPITTWCRLAALFPNAAIGAASGGQPWSIEVHHESATEAATDTPCPGAGFRQSPARTNALGMTARRVAGADGGVAAQTVAQHQTRWRTDA